MIKTMLPWNFKRVSPQPLHHELGQVINYAKNTFNDAECDNDEPQERRQQPFIFIDKKYIQYNQLQVPFSKGPCGESENSISAKFD